MDPKRQTLHAPVATPQSSFSGLIDDSLTRELASIGPRVRKQISDGHKTPGSLPSFTGSTVGSLDQDTIRQQMYGDAGVAAQPFRSMGVLENNLKRDRNDFDDDDTYGDTDADGDETEDHTRRIASLKKQWAKDRSSRSGVQLPTRSSSEHKTYFVPASHGSSSVHDGDFEEATFLQPQ